LRYNDEHCNPKRYSDSRRRADLVINIDVAPAVVVVIVIVLLLRARPVVERLAGRRMRDLPGFWARVLETLLLQTLSGELHCLLLLELHAFAVDLGVDEVLRVPEDQLLRFGLALGDAVLLDVVGESGGSMVGGSVSEKLMVADLFVLVGGECHELVVSLAFLGVDVEHVGKI